MKKIISILLTLTFLLSLSVEVMADEPEVQTGRHVVLFTGSSNNDAGKHYIKSVYINNKEYIPLDDFLQYVPYNKEWDANTQTMRLWSPYRDCKFTINSNEYYFNGWLPSEVWITSGEKSKYQYWFYPKEVARYETFYSEPPIMVNNNIYIPYDYPIIRLFYPSVKEIDNVIHMDVYPTFYDFSVCGYFNSTTTTGIDIYSMLKGDRISRDYETLYPIVNNEQKKGFKNYELFDLDIEGVVSDVEDMGYNEYNIELENVTPYIRNYYLKDRKEGLNFQIVCGSEDRINTRCFDSDFNEIKPEDLENLVGSVVRFCHKSNWFWGSPWVEDPDQFMYAMVKDNVLTEEHKQALEEEERELERRWSTEITVYYNMYKVDFDQPPIIEDGRTLVPIRGVFELIGANVDWNGDTKTVTINNNKKVIQLTVDENMAYIDGEPVELDVPARILNDRTIVPLRFLAETLNCTVEWDDVNRIVALFANK